MIGNPPYQGGGLLGQLVRNLRWRLRRVYTGGRYGRVALESAPILFGNSFPKSGTHLLAQVLQAFPHIGLAVDRGMGPILTFVRHTGRQRSPNEILADLHRLKPGDLGFGHIIAASEIVKAWCHAHIAHYLIYRDPRDVVVSHAFYIAEKATQNVHHEFYRSLPGLEERIRVSILGRPDFEAPFPDIQSRYALYLEWLDCRWVCPLRFEDLVSNRSETLGRLLDHAVDRGFHLHMDRQRAIESLSAAMDPQRSFTFRQGKAGDWRNHFTSEHKQLFKDIAGDLLIRLGYEKDLDW